jgi:hypothetical protein
VSATEALITPSSVRDAGSLGMFPPAPEGDRSFLKIARRREADPAPLFASSGTRDRKCIGFPGPWPVFATVLTQCNVETRRRIG